MEEMGKIYKEEMCVVRGGRSQAQKWIWAWTQNGLRLSARRGSEKCIKTSEGVEEGENGGYAIFSDLSEKKPLKTVPHVVEILTHSPSANCVHIPMRTLTRPSSGRTLNQVAHLQL